MAIQKISTDHFLSLSKEHPVIDVRSPSEFLHAHIPSAHNLPLFSDEERKVTGTIYKQQSRQQAIKAGLNFFGEKMKEMVEEAENIVAGFRLSIHGKQQPTTTGTVLIHCWRGGMRSSAVAWLLDLYGFKVYTLAGGYKAFRNFVLNQFEKPYNLKILGGYTGSGKTGLIEELQRLKQFAIDLELLASHKGSAFGDLGEKPQPSQEMFENLLALELLYKPQECIWLEDESRRIGRLNIPAIFWEKMRNSPVYFIDIPFEERLNYLVSTYGKFSREALVNSILRIQKKLGGFETKNAVSFLAQNNIAECFCILLKYYDKCYGKGLSNRIIAGSPIYKIPCKTVTINNREQFLCFLKESTSDCPAETTNKTTDYL